MAFSPFSKPRAWAEIDTAALSDNFRALSCAFGGRTIAVVKANAYGHGIPLAVPAFVSAGCDFFAVATAEEALEVRALAPRADILVLGYAPIDAVADLARAKITQTVFSAPFAEQLSRAARRAGVVPRVHLKVDGGMCRLGFSPGATDEMRAVFSLENLTVRGLFTHYPNADTAAAATRRALAGFLRVRAQLPPGLFAHTAASAAALSCKEAVLDGARPGIALYGYAPVPTGLSLRPALRLFAPVVQVREVPCGTPVGYGGDFVARRPSRVGTLPVGYADGLTRDLCGLTVSVFHAGRRYPAPLCGRICMDYCMVDLTDVPAAVGDAVCVIGDIPAAAARRRTIPYEVLTGLSARVERRQKGDRDGLLRDKTK